MKGSTDGRKGGACAQFDRTGRGAGKARGRTWGAHKEGARKQRLWGEDAMRVVGGSTDNRAAKADRSRGGAVRTGLRYSRLISRSSLMTGTHSTGVSSSVAVSFSAAAITSAIATAWGERPIDKQLIWKRQRASVERGSSCRSLRLRVAQPPVSRAALAAGPAVG